MEGWICPKCGKSLAPWMSECNCTTRKPNRDLDLEWRLQELEQRGREKYEFDMEWSPDR